MKAALEVILFILAFGAVLFLTYVATKFVAGKSSQSMKGKHISVIETISLGTDKRLHLIKVGGQHFIIATTSKQVQFLDKVDIPVELEETDNQPQIDNNVFDFKKFFEKYVNNYRTKKISGENPLKAGQTVGMSEDIVFRSNLDKLRNITQKKNIEAYKNGVDFTNEE